MDFFINIIRPTFIKEGHARGGSRNSLRGGGVLSQNSSRGGLGSRSVGIFIYWQAKKTQKTSEGGGGKPPNPPPDPLLHAYGYIQCRPLYIHIRVGEGILFLSRKKWHWFSHSNTVSISSNEGYITCLVIKGFGMSSLVYATGHIKDPVPLVEKSRGLSPGGRFPPSFIHQVIIITGLNKLQLYVLALKMALDADRA